MPEWKSFTFGEDGEATPTPEQPRRPLPPTQPWNPTNTPPSGAPRSPELTIERIVTVLEGDGLECESNEFIVATWLNGVPLQIHREPAERPVGAGRDPHRPPGRGPHRDLPAGAREPLERRAPPAHCLPHRERRQLDPRGCLPILRRRGPVGSPDPRDGPPRPHHRPAGRRGAAHPLDDLRIPSSSLSPLAAPSTSAPFLTGAGHSR